MITRIVRMTFHKRHVPDFLKMFGERRDRIRSREGCSYLGLYRESRFSNVFFTISHWRDEESLNSYRQSNLFENTWSLTKSWFADRPRAWSLEEMESPT